MLCVGTIDREACAGCFDLGESLQQFFDSFVGRKSSQESEMQVPCRSSRLIRTFTVRTVISPLWKLPNAVFGESPFDEPGAQRRRGGHEEID